MRAHLVSPWHSDRARQFRARRSCADSLQRLSRSNHPDCSGSDRAVEVHPFALPLVGKHDGHVGALRQSGRGRRICTRVKLNLRARSLRREWLSSATSETISDLPPRLTLARRHDRVSSRRIDLRRSSARDHPHIGMWPDYRDAANLGRIERKLRLSRFAAAPCSVLPSSAPSQNRRSTSTTLFCAGSSTTPLANIARTMRCT